MRGLRLGRLVRGFPSRFAMMAPSRSIVGGRRRPGKFGDPTKIGRPVNAKQAAPNAIPKPIPGTTKVNYVNRTGRVFSFSIPVAQLTHPPITRNSFSPDGWKSLDTSYCDTGDLEEDMPSLVDDCLRRHTYEESGESYVRLDEEALRDVYTSFVTLCREYVLMDTRGMTTTLTYNELNNGPDYQMYDRKAMRRRYWLSIRHRFNDVKELLWPSDLITPQPPDGVSTDAPLLSSDEMITALTWVEAASAFCIRTRRPYDFAPTEEFTPIDISRELRVLVKRVQADPLAFFHGGAAAGGDTEASRISSDRFISCGAMCAKYKVPFASFFASGIGESTSVMRPLLASLPASTTVKDTVRIMSLLSGAATVEDFRFTDERGNVTNAETLKAMTLLCSKRLFGESDSLQTVHEDDLCIIMEFVVVLHEQNPQFFTQPPLLDNDSICSGYSTLTHFSHLAVARCRYLLYRLGGPQTSVMSSDEENIPFVELQKHTERTNPHATIHYKVGMENAQGLRFARLGARTSATLVELMRRLEHAGSNTTNARTLISDLVHHVAHKVAGSQCKLSFDDVARVLPSVAHLLASDPSARNRYERLLAACGTAIGIGVQRDFSADELVRVLEGFAACQYVPTSFRQIEVVMLRLFLHGGLTPSHLSAALSAMAKLVGSSNVSPALLQNAAALVVRSTKTEVPVGEVSALLDLLRCLNYCHYTSFAELILRCRDQKFFSPTVSWRPLDQASLAVLYAFAAYQLPEDDSNFAPLTAEAKKALEVSLTEEEEVGPHWPADLVVDTVRACAALEYRTLSPSIASCSTLHSLCTPLLAVGVLESLESLQFMQSAMYDAHISYASSALDHLSAAESVVLLPHDADFAVRTLYLHSAPSAIWERAGRLLAREIVRLSAAPAEATSEASSFELRHLHQGETRSRVEASLARYCTALQQNRIANRILTEGT